MGVVTTRERPQRRVVPRYAEHTPASLQASEAARAASRKRDTRCEIVLRRELYARGLRYRVDVRTLPGRPDLVFLRERVAVFCDGDFWHGRDLAHRLEKLARGHNAAYWVPKIARNVERDREHDAALNELDWVIVRLWETDILRSPALAADAVVAAVIARRQASGPTRTRGRAVASPSTSNPRPRGVTSPR